MKIGLVNMPPSSFHRPSIQLARLQAQVRSAGHECETFYPNVKFASLVGTSLYNHFSEQSDILFGHWLFAEALNGFENSNPQDYLERFKLRLGTPDFEWKQLREYYLVLRQEKAPEFIRDLCHEVNWGSFDYVGFTCTFSQLIPSLAMAQAIKERWPQVKILLGGAEVQGAMGQEVAKQCLFIDHVVQGEGENAIIELLHAPNASRVFESKKPVSLDQLPMPSFDDYFETVDALGDPLISIAANSIPIEASRGCWWGQKHHCKFCGLNGDSMTFRSRPAQDVLDEIVTQSEKYDRYLFEFIDNIIDYRYLKNLIPQMGAKATSLTFFCETKANLKREELEALKLAGFNAIQPGIESLSTPVLRIMDKGVKAHQNVELLRWAAELDVQIQWNILYGFPDETEQDYKQMISLIESIFHLEPPSGCAPLRIDRFSPYHRSIKNQASPYFENLRPAVAYEMIYPKNWNLWELAYFFEGDGINSVKPETYARLCRVVDEWKAAWKRDAKPELLFRQAFNHGHIIDRRKLTTEIYKIESDVFTVVKELLKHSRTLESLTATTMLESEVVEEIVDELCELRVCARVDDRVLFLPTRDSKRPSTRPLADSESEQKARSLAHDLRSPLSALNVVLGKAKGLDSNLQTLLASATKRFQDLADDFQNWAKGDE